MSIESAGGAKGSCPRFGIRQKSRRTVAERFGRSRRTQIDFELS